MDIFRKNPQNKADKNDDHMIEIQWGGFYASKNENKFGIFRLLDFNTDACHIQLFQEKFDHIPSFDEAKKLEPYIWHVPIAVGGLVDHDELIFIGHQNLDEQALIGYEEYLSQMGAEEANIEKMLKELIEYSTLKPMKIKISKSGDEIFVTPME